MLALFAVLVGMAFAVDDCKCKSSWDYKGKKYHGCSYTDDSTDKKWCYVVGGTACVDATPATEPSAAPTDAWQFCNTCEEKNKKCKLCMRDMDCVYDTLERECMFGATATPTPDTVFIEDDCPSCRTIYAGDQTGCEGDSQCYWTFGDTCADLPSPGTCAYHDKERDEVGCNAETNTPCVWVNSRCVDDTGPAPTEPPVTPLKHCIGKDQKAKNIVCMLNHNQHDCASYKETNPNTGVVTEHICKWVDKVDCGNLIKKKHCNNEDSCVYHQRSRTCVTSTCNYTTRGLPCRGGCCLERKGCFWHREQTMCVDMHDVDCTQLP